MTAHHSRGLPRTGMRLSCGCCLVTAHWPMSRDRFGLKPLLWATSEGHSDLVLLLLD